MGTYLSGAQRAEYAQRYYQWLHDNPGESTAEAAKALGLSESKVESLLPAARRCGGGYYVPPDRTKGHERYTAADIIDAIRLAAAFHSVPPGGQFTPNMYAPWRASIPQDSHYPASTQVWGRRFTTVNDAIRAAGFTPDERERDYGGWGPADMVPWLARWLRDLRLEHPDTMARAQLKDYKQWAARNNAPSPETLRKYGTYGDLVVHAARLERARTHLPEPTPRSNNGRRKNTCSCGAKGANTKSGLCDRCAPRCTYVGDEHACGQPAHYDLLCWDHEQQRLAIERAAGLNTRWRTYYLVYWPEHGAFKVGLEAGGGQNGPQRVRKWQRTGAQVVTRIVRHGDDEAIAEAMFDIEQELKNDLPCLGYQHPDRQEWLEVVGASSAYYPASPDGWTETFLLTPGEDIERELDYITLIMLETLGETKVNGRYIGDFFTEHTGDGVVDQAGGQTDDD